jgi:fibronectin type 3 domain-containing protein
MTHIKSFVGRLGIQMLLLAYLVCPSFSSAQTVTSIPLTSLPQNTRLMIWGDSVTEIPAWYPRYIEGYLLQCMGRQDIKVLTAGHSGATLGETLSRQIDLQAFNPTIVQFLYGFNDVNFGETTSQWDSTLQSVFTLYKSKGITPIVAGPGWTDGNNGNPATPDAFEQSLQAFNAICHTDAVNAGAYESDLCDSMEISLDNAIATYGTSYTIAEHYTPNGAILVAYEDLKTLGCTGNIGTVTVNMSAGTATASSGHTVVSYSNGTVVLDSTTYPFCYNFDPNEYGGTTGIASMLPYVNFSQDLNRFVLTVTNLGAASANVTWGSQTINFTSAQLAAGVNLPANFTSTPFDTTFAQVMAAIVNKQYFEDYEIKGTSNYFGNDNGGNVDNNMIAYQAGLDAAVKALIVPVRHSIVIVPQGASTSVAPVITGTMMAYPTVGQNFSYQISALNSPTSYSATGLPAGLTINTTTGVISGTPSATGITVVPITATNAYGTSLATHLTISVTNPIPAAPTITSPLTATATVGSAFAYQMTATGNPTNFFAVVPSNVGTEPPNSSLPPGLNYNTVTGLLSGTPTTAGTYNIEVAAVNAGGVGVLSESNPLVLTINPASGGAPPAPTGLTATAGSSQVSLSWGASAGATSYSIYRGTSAGGESATAIATGVTSASYVDTTVTNGTTYYYKVTAVNSSGASGYSNEASATPVSGLPAAPAALTATAGNAQVALSWTASSGATSYNVYRGSLPGQENTTPIATGITTTSYLDTTVNNGPTFYYKVTAVNSAGTSSYSNEASATPTAPALPPAPTGLTATAGNTLAVLSWTASTGATSYNVYRGTSSGGESTTAIATGITTTSYTNTGLTNGTAYYYKVAAVNSSGTSTYSNEASATPTGGSGTTTYYQDSFSRTGDMTGSTPDVTDTGGATWANLAGTGQYPISGGTASINPAAYSWSAEYLPVNGTSGITLDGTKNFTVSVVVTSPSTGRVGLCLSTAAPGNLYSSDFAAMSTCSGFTGAYAFNGGNINYNFGAGISGATTISMSYNAATTTLTYTVGSTTLATQTGVTAAEVAAIRYVGLGDDGYGGGAAAPAPTFDNFTFTVGSGGGGTVPAAPTGLAATAGNAQVALTWTASSGATSYNVYRGTTAGGESTTAIATGITTASYSDTSVTNGTAYYYKVTAINSSGASGYSNEASATPLAVPTAPTGLVATAGNTQVGLVWTASSGATSYNVYRGTTAGGESTTAIATGVTSASYTNTGLTNGTTYYYKITAVNSSGASGYSNEASATPLAVPTAPAGLVATAGNTQVGLSWTASTGATSYNVYRGTTSGGESSTAIVTGLTTTSYTNTGLTNGTAYYYTVAAVNSIGTSGYSNEASATPTAGGTGATTYYQDSFSRTGDMTGSTPDVTDTGAATWGNLAGTGQYPISGGTAAIAIGAYSWSAEYLPVNGTTGITLDGTKDFSLSVVVTAGSSGLTGISLNTAAPGNLFSSSFASLATCSGFAGAYAFNGGLTNYNYAAGISGPTTISLAYSASAATLTYKVGTTVVYTQTGVTQAEVATIRYVALGDDGYGGSNAAPAPTFDNFTFTVGSGSGTAPATPTGLAATAGNAQVALTWTASSGATTYNVYRGTTAGGESTTAVATGVTTTAYTDSSLTNGTTYYYKVAAVNSAGTSGYSNEASATPTGGTAPSAPTGLTATPGNAQAALAWTASSGATSYNVYRGTTAGGESTTAIATGVTTTSYTNTALTNGTTYYYKVAAVNSIGTSGYSNEASATPTAGTATTYYSDSFSRTGDITGSTPDVTDTGGATWANMAGTGQYPISGGTASINPAAYSWSAEYLPVNGTSGITLDGTKNFTLSVVVTAGSSGLTGISLTTAAPGNLFSSTFAALATCSGFAGAYSFNGGLINYNYSPGITGPTTVSISYNAVAGTVTYMVGSTTVNTQTGVTPAEVSAIRYVTLGDDGYGGGDATPAPTFDNFAFSVGP